MYQNDSKQINKRNLLVGLFLTGLILLSNHSSQLGFLPEQVSRIIGLRYVQLALFLPVLLWVPENLWLNAVSDFKRRQLPRDLLFILAVLIGLISSLVSVVNPSLIGQYSLQGRTYFGTLSSLIIIKEISDFGLSYWLKSTNYDRNVSFFEKNLFLKIQRYSLFSLALFVLISLAWLYLTQAPFYLVIGLVMSGLVVMSPKYLLFACSGLVSQTMKILDRKKIKLSNPENLMRLSDLGRVIFFKTGVLTTGKLNVIDLVAAKPKDLLKLAGSLEQSLISPIALAIQDKVGKDKIDLNQVSDQKMWPGLGVTGVINGRKIALGNMALMKKENIVVGVLQREKSRLEKMGKKVLVLGSVTQRKSIQDQPGEVLGLIALEDKTRPGAKGVIEYLRQQGIESWVVTGESRVSAEVFGQELGLGPDNILSEILPHQRGPIIGELKKRTQSSQGIALVHLSNGRANYGGILDINIVPKESSAEVQLDSSIYIDDNQLSHIEDMVGSSLNVSQKFNLNALASLVYLAIFVPTSLGLFLFAPLNLYIHPVLALILSSLLGGGLVVNSTIKNKS